MGLLRKTISRQMEVPLYGERPEWALLANVDNTSITKKTLVNEFPKDLSGTYIDGSNAIQIGDGEQGWYLIEVGGSKGTTGAGGAARYVAYLHPGTKCQMWGARNALTGATASLYQNCLGGTSNSGGGAAMGGASANSGAGAGFVAMMDYNAEPSYHAQTSIYYQTAYGFSNTTRLHYVGGTKEISLGPDSTYNADGLFGWSGVMTDEGVATSVVGRTRSPVGTVGQEITLYNQAAPTTPIGTYNATDVTKTTIYTDILPTSGTSGNSVYNDAGTKLGTTTATGTTTTLDGNLLNVTYSSTVYIQDDTMHASYDSDVQYYAWMMGMHKKDKRLMYSLSSTNPLALGQFLYEECDGEIVISYTSTYSEFDSRFCTRLPSKDRKGKRVVFGTATRGAMAGSGLGPTVPGGARTYFGYNGTGAYVLVLAGGGSDGSGTYGGGALGWSGPDTLSDQTYPYRRGPAQLFGRTANTTGAWSIVDMNDGYINWGTGGNTEVKDNIRWGYCRLYKLSPADEETKYSQRVILPASSEGYSVVMELNGRTVFNKAIPASKKETNEYILDVKQGDVLKIEITDAGGAVTGGFYNITTESIAFGLVPTISAWKVFDTDQAFTIYNDKKSGSVYLQKGKYATIIAGGGGGGGYKGVDYSDAGGNGGAGETALTSIIRFELDNGQEVFVNRGRGGHNPGNGTYSSIVNTYGQGSSTRAPYNGGSRGESTHSGGHGAGAGDSSYILLGSTVHVDNLPMRLYSWTNGSNVRYTKQSYPKLNGRTIDFVNENGEFVARGYTTIESNGRTTITDISTGLKYEDSLRSGNANKDIVYSGDTNIIFSIGGAGGGGGGAGRQIDGRYAQGGAGGGGGGFYRFDAVFVSEYNVTGGYGGSLSTGSGGGGYQGQDCNQLDGPSAAGGAGYGGYRAGGNGRGGYGFGGGGGGGGTGGNHGYTEGGHGGGGAGGSYGAGWGGANTGNLHRRISDYKNAYIWRDLFGTPSQSIYGFPGTGGAGFANGSANTPGLPGRVWIYRFDEVTSVDDAGSIGEFVTTPITQEFWLIPYSSSAAATTTLFYVLYEEEPVLTDLYTLSVGDYVYDSLLEAIAVDSGTEEPHGSITYVVEE